MLVGMLFQAVLMSDWVVRDRKTLSAAMKPPGVIVIAPNCSCLLAVTKAGTAPSGSASRRVRSRRRERRVRSRLATARTFSLARWVCAPMVAIAAFIFWFSALIWRFSAFSAWISAAISASDGSACASVTRLGTSSAPASPMIVARDPARAGHCSSCSHVKPPSRRTEGSYASWEYGIKSRKNNALGNFLSFDQEKRCLKNSLRCDSRRLRDVAATLVAARSALAVTRFVTFVAQPCDKAAPLPVSERRG